VDDIIYPYHFSLPAVVTAQVVSTPVRGGDDAVAAVVFKMACVLSTVPCAETLSVGSFARRP